MEISLPALTTDFYNGLSGIYTPQEASHLLFRILVHTTQKPLPLLRAEKSIFLKNEDHDFIYDALSKLIRHMPIQYILGYEDFYGRRFHLNNETLIPRTETEELCQWIIEEIGDRKCSLLDLGTGSGCIAISLAKELPNCQVAACDISLAALSVAKQNALQWEAKVQFFSMDILQIENFNTSAYDVLVSNPPYVCQSEKSKMNQNVLLYEPHTALFVDDHHALIFYEAIIALAKKQKRPCTVYFECNEAKEDEMQVLFENTGAFEMELKKDIFGKFRFAKAVYPNNA